MYIQLLFFPPPHKKVKDKKEVPSFLSPLLVLLLLVLGKDLTGKKKTSAAHTQESMKDHLSCFYMTTQDDFLDDSCVRARLFFPSDSPPVVVVVLVVVVGLVAVGSFRFVLVFFFTGDFALLATTTSSFFPFVCLRIGPKYVRKHI